MARPGSSLLRQVYNSSVHRPIGVPDPFQEVSWRYWVHNNFCPGHITCRPTNDDRVNWLERPVKGTE